MNAFKVGFLMKRSEGSNKEMWRKSWATILSVCSEQVQPEMCKMLWVIGNGFAYHHYYSPQLLYTYSSSTIIKPGARLRLQSNKKGLGVNTTVLLLHHKNLDNCNQGYL